MQIFAVLADRTRRDLVQGLLGGERSVGDLVEALGAPQPTVSRHLRILREAGIVEARVDAQRRLYRLRPEPLRELDAWLEPYRLVWSGRLDALERHLDEGEES